jgi:microcystin-dependent protein
MVIGPPVGSVMAFAGSLDAQDDPWTNLQFFTWRTCDGAALSRLEFPDLFSALGYTYGGADNSFCLPDYAGYFFRALATTPEQDPDIGDRKAASATAKATGVGSTQQDALQDHVHPHGTTILTQTAQSGGPPVVESADTGSPETTKATPVPGRTIPPVSVSEYETRPKNVYVNWIIKVAYTPAELAQLTGERRAGAPWTTGALPKPRAGPR